MPGASLQPASRNSASGLLAYPIPGSQLYFASALLLPLLVLSLADLARFTGASATACARAGLAGALVTLLLLAWALQGARSHFLALQPLDLPGSGALRLPAQQVEHFQQLATAYDSADVGFATWGFNSLYSWSSARPPAPVLIISPMFAVNYLDDDQLASIRLGLEQAKRPVVLVRRSAWRRPTAGDNRLQDWLRDNYRPARRVGPYLVLRPITRGPGAD